jgi:hypothetical protein
MSPLGQGNVVSADAAVGDLLDWIVDPGFLFVVEGRSIVGFISVSDFNKHPVRGYLYLQLASLEMNLAELVKVHFQADQERMLDYLAAKARNNVKASQRHDQGNRLDTDLVAYLNFAHLLDIARCDPALVARLGPEMARDAEILRNELNDLRRRVMHPVKGLVSDKGELMTLRDSENSIARLSRGVVAALRAEPA